MSASIRPAERADAAAIAAIYAHYVATTAATFDEAGSCWTVTTDDGDVTTARFLVMATGCLSSANLPHIEGRDPIQAYCDVLEHKWLLSERAKRDVGLEAAIKAYLEEGAPLAPEVGPAVEPVEESAV